MLTYIHILIVCRRIPRTSGCRTSPLLLVYPGPRRTCNNTTRSRSSSTGLSATATTSVVVALAAEILPILYTAGYGITAIRIEYIRTGVVDIAL